MKKRASERERRTKSERKEERERQTDLALRGGTSVVNDRGYRERSTDRPTHRAASVFVGKANVRVPVITCVYACAVRE